jgi:hypothetical protein
MKVKFEEWAAHHMPNLDLDSDGERYEWLDTENAFDIFKAGATAGLSILQENIEERFFEEMENIRTGKVQAVEGESTVRQSLKAAIKNVRLN